MAAGIFAQPIVVPMELLKSRAQMKTDGSMNYFKEINGIMKESGAKGMYRGFTGSFWRFVPGWTSQFWTFDVVNQHKKSFAQKYAKSPKNQKRLELLWTLHAGGCAGIVTWLV